MRKAHADSKGGLAISGRRLGQKYESSRAVMDYYSICTKLGVSETVEPHLYSGCQFLKLANKKAKLFVDTDAWLSISVSLINMAVAPSKLKPEIERLRSKLKERHSDQLPQVIQLHDDLLDRWSNLELFQKTGAAS